MKKQVLKEIAKAAKGAAKETCGSKSWFYFYEEEMPKALKEKKNN